MKLLSAYLAVAAFLLVTCDLAYGAKQFSFSLPGRWGTGKRTPFKFTLPGNWGNLGGRRIETASMVEECSAGTDVERMFEILTRLQEEEAKLRQCILNLTYMERNGKPE